MAQGPNDTKAKIVGLFTQRIVDGWSVGAAREWLVDHVECEMAQLGGSESLQRFAGDQAGKWIDEILAAFAAQHATVTA